MADCRKVGGGHPLVPADMLTGKMMVVYLQYQMNVIAIKRVTEQEVSLYGIIDICYLAQQQTTISKY